MAKLYLLCRVPVTGGFSTPFVLNMDGYDSRQAANRAKAWQEIGQGGFDRHNICTRTGPADFRDEDTGETFTADIGPYTAQAWARFLEEWKA